MKIIIGSDHAGFDLKREIKRHLKDLNYEFEDLGCYSKESCDYPDYGFKVAERVAKENGKGILICGSGIGMSIAANKVKGVRAALCQNEEEAKLSREHNNSNILCLGARIISPENAKNIVKIWLETKFSGEERHERRIKKITNFEND